MSSQASIIPFPTPHAGCSGRGEVDCSACQVRLASICSALEIDEMQAFESIARSVCVAPKEALFFEDDEADAAFTVTGGVARLYRVFRDGRRQIVGFLLPGDFIGIEAEGRHEFSADAVTPLSLCRFPRSEFNALLERKPQLIKKMQLTSAAELSSARDHMMALGQRSAREKIAWFLIHLRNRWARIEQPSDRVSVPMSRQDIADFLGLTIETVSRTLTQFARDRAIEIEPNGIRMIDGKKIERLAAA